MECSGEGAASTLSPAMTRASTKKHPRLAALWQSIHGVVGEFAIGGNVPLRETISFRHESLKRAALSPANGDYRLLQKREPLMTRLVKLCRDAPFGHNGESKIDHSVRDALQLRAGDGGFALEGFDPAAAGVLATVQAALAPNDPAPLRAEFYGLNVYRAGGHFAPHKDTPRGDHMLGTLVLLLPSDYWGGALVVSHQGVEHRFFDARGSRSREDNDALPWAAFFDDVDHRVERVSSGDRLTLTWTLHRAPGAPAQPALDGSTRERLGAALRDAINDPSFFSEGATLGMLCVHRYVHGVDAPLTARPLDATTVLALKGRDQLVALAALDAGLAVELQPLVVETCAELAWPLKRFLVSREESVFQQKRLDGSRLVERLESKLADSDPYAANKFIDGLVDAWIAPTMRIGEQGVEGESPAWRLLGEPEFSATGYFGNEGGPTEFYAAAMLVIRVPSR